MARVSMLDPTSPPLPVDASMAERPDTLNGKVLGLLDNHKLNANNLLDDIEQLLSERYEFAEVVRSFKPDVSRPAPSDTLDELIEQCDVAVTAIGD